MLRIESFSECRSVYGRIDFTPDALSPVDQSFGSSNIDFNVSLRNALGRVVPGDQLGLCVEASDVTLIHNAETYLEKKVNLPEAWLRGFASIPEMENASELVLEKKGNEVRSLFQQIPRKSNDRGVYWLTLERGGRIAMCGRPGAVEIKGINRLLLLYELIPYADRLSVWHDKVTGGTVWRLGAGGLRFSLAVSHEPWRGFSGEGGELRRRIHEPDADLEEYLESETGPLPEPEDLALRFGISLPAVHATFSVLAGRGKLAFDSAENRWFRRAIPASDAMRAKEPPRLKQARSWLESGAVVPLPAKNGVHYAEIRLPENRMYLVSDDSENGARCTCQWFARHRLSRGPCSHILAHSLHLQSP